MSTALRPGMSGPNVAALQQRLAELGYFVPRTDGDYDETTVHAVTAFQKVNGLDRDGIAGPETVRALDTATRPEARDPSRRSIEIDLTRQVLLVVDEGAVRLVLDVSTGTGSRTPTGRYRVEREIDGYHRSELGVLYRPKYVVGGVAVHGFPSVPPFPASHGCIRTINPAMDWLWEHDAMPIGTPVWIYR
ncbi:MAG TPA: L,D-transpeptidase family protein [Acidimicrobiia bacterium]|nr:L,D-transpeptidase family protein [Acidimicrobiia bacterium]